MCGYLRGKRYLLQERVLLQHALKLALPQSVLLDLLLLSLVVLVLTVLLKFTLQTPLILFLASLLFTNAFSLF